MDKQAQNRKHKNNMENAGENKISRYRNYPKGRYMSLRHVMEK